MREVEETFLREVAARPDDDMPRLVYADWLEEQGDPRSEFIRLQCERETLPWHAPRWWELLDREEALLTQHGKAWIKAATKLRRTEWGINTWTSFRAFTGEGPRVFQRGFPEAARVHNVQALILATDAPLSTFLRDAQLQVFSPRWMGRLIASGWLRRLRGIALNGKWLGRDFLEPLGLSSAAAGLRRLELEGNRVQRSSLEALCESPYLTSLETLNLANNRLEGVDLQLLANWPGMRNLRSLCLAGNALRDGAAAFLSSPAIGSLHVLDLGGCLGDESMAESLADNGHLRKLTHLSLTRNFLQSANIVRLFERRACPELRVLNLVQGDVRDETLETIANSPMSSQLRVLSVGHPLGQITARGIHALAKATQLAELRRLTLDNVEIDRELAAALAESPSLSRLQHLYVDEPMLSPDVRQRLSGRFTLHLRRPNRFGNKS